MGLQHTGLALILMILFPSDKIQQGINRFVGFLLILFLSGNATGQLNTYIVTFKDKASNPFSISNPLSYLSQRAIDRRVRYQIPIDSFDLPVTPRYMDSLRLAGDVSIINTSKWLNQAAIHTTDADALAHIISLPFVLSVSAIAPRIHLTNQTDRFTEQTIDINNVSARETNLTGYYNYGKSNGQVTLHHGDFLHNHGFRGRGIQMCVLDAGFYHYLTLPTFDSIRINNQILGTWDFVDNEEEVNGDHTHGTQCLSTIAANIPGLFVGTAPETEFYLFRTEKGSSEYPLEEQNLAVGWERADSLGVDVCSVSLGYTTFDDPSLNHTYNDMNGHTTIAARAADIASTRGMLILVAMGNEGTNSWHYLSTPADAVGILSVGAVDTTGVVGSFSSYGPSSDGRVKPEVSATGVYAVVANTSTGLPSYGFGTSFACPNMAGIAGCLWQAFPEYSNQVIMDVLEKSSNQYNHPDDRRGYGIPDARDAFVRLQKKGYLLQSDIVNCSLQFSVSVKTDPSMRLILQRKRDFDSDFIALDSMENNNPWNVHSFTFLDDVEDLQGTNVHYRMIMEIGSDTTYMLDSLSIQVPSNTCSSTEGGILVSPNPTNNNVILEFPLAEAGKLSIVLYNASGQRVYIKEENAIAGHYHGILPMTALPAGTYVAGIYLNNKRIFSHKIIRH